MKNNRGIKFIQGNKVNCCNIDNLEDNEEISILEKTINELSEKNERKNHHMQKLKREHEKMLEEALQNESELNDLIRGHEEKISELEFQLKQLEDELLEKTKETKTAGVQTEKTTNCKNKQTSTDSIPPHSGVRNKLSINNKNPQNKIIDLNKTEPKPINPSSDVIKRTVLIVAGHLGKGLGEIIHNNIDGNFSIMSFIKPNADDKTLICTALENSKHLTKNDTVILWPNTLGPYIEHEFIRKMEHTKSIIITEPYHHNGICVDNIIYNCNLSLIKELHYKQIKTVNILECNNILRNSNLIKNGHQLNKSGKWHLSRALINHIKQETGMVEQDKKSSLSLNSSGEVICQKLSYSRRTPKQVQVQEKRNRLSIEEELQIYQEGSPETPRNITDTSESEPIDKTNNFLYPRLSQIHLSLM